MDISLTPHLSFAMDRLGLADELLDDALWLVEPEPLHERMEKLAAWSRVERLGHLTTLIDVAHYLNSVLDLSDGLSDWDGEGKDPYEPLMSLAHEAAKLMLTSVLSEMQAVFLVANQEQNEDAH